MKKYAIYNEATGEITSIVHTHCEENVTCKLQEGESYMGCTDTVDVFSHKVDPQKKAFKRTKAKTPEEKMFDLLAKRQKPEKSTQKMQREIAELKAVVEQLKGNK